MNKETVTKIHDYIDRRQAEILSMLEEFVKTPSCSREPEVMPEATEWVCRLLKNENYRVRTWEVGNGNAPVIVADLMGQEDGAPVIFSGHYDTALNRELSARNPFRVEDGKVYGTGTLDMKGGIVIAIYAVRAAAAAGVKKPIRFILAGDEEINHKNSKAAEIMKEEAKGAVCAFNMETGLISNQLAIFRKGGTRCRITTHGVEAHAGNDFTKGRSAIAEMAYKVVDIHNLTDLSVGTTMNIGTIQGGTIFNCVPAKCEAVVDMRFEKNEELEKGKAALKAVCEKTYIEGTTTEMEYIDIMHVFETTEGGLKLLKFLQDTARETGLRDVGQAQLGGSSDAAYITMAGVPTVCSAGAMGEWNHTEREYIMQDSLYERAKLYAGALLRMDQFEA